ncbi:MAG: YjfI family protein [Pseudomonadota bacterium]
MEKKTSAHYQREFRRRLREQGLIKKEVWIHPERASQLREIEKRLRFSGENVLTDGENSMTSRTNGTWHTTDLYTEIEKSELISSGAASVELIEGVDPSIHLEMRDYGDLPIFVTVAGEQITADAVLWPKSAVSNAAGFNDAVLRTHKYFPLSTISLETVNGEDYYYMFGALSAASGLDDVLVEIDALASNVINATEAYGEFLKFDS